MNGLFTISLFNLATDGSMIGSPMVALWSWLETYTDYSVNIYANTTKIMSFNAIRIFTFKTYANFIGHRT